MNLKKLSQKFIAPFYEEYEHNGIWCRETEDKRYMCLGKTWGCGRIFNSISQWIEHAEAHESEQ